MDYKVVKIEDINRILGFDISNRSKDKTVIRGRQGAWLCFYINGHTYVDIGRIFGVSGSSVAEGVDRFEDKLKEGDSLTLEIWNKLKVYEL